MRADGRGIRGESDAHPVIKSYSREHDFPRRHTRPDHKYMLAATPRSGSTFLSSLLWQTGLLGAPLEYFNLANRGDDVLSRGNGSADDYIVDILSTRTTPNGVFGFKMFVNHYGYLADHHPSLLSELSCDKVIFLARQDVLGQAISHVRAEQTKAWFAASQGLAEPEYSFEQIVARVSEIAASIERWLYVFRVTGESPLPVLYEDVTKQPDIAIARIVDFLKPPVFPRADIPNIFQPKRQSDNLTERWRARFNAEIGERENEANTFSAALDTYNNGLRRLGFDLGIDRT